MLQNSLFRNTEWEDVKFWSREWFTFFLSKQASFFIISCVLKHKKSKRLRQIAKIGSLTWKIRTLFFFQGLVGPLRTLAWDHLLGGGKFRAFFPSKMIECRFKKKLVHERCQCIIGTAPYISGQLLWNERNVFWNNWKWSY